MRAYRFIIIRPFRPGCHCSEQPYSKRYGQTSPLQGPQSLVIISRFLSMLFPLNML